VENSRIPAAELAPNNIPVLRPEEQVNSAYIKDHRRRAGVSNLPRRLNEEARMLAMECTAKCSRIPNHKDMAPHKHTLLTKVQEQH